MKNKRLFLLLMMVAVMLGTLYVSCGGGSSTTESKNIDDLGKFEIRISVGNTESHPQTLGLKVMKEYIEEKTHGNVKVAIFANSQLGSEDESLEQVQSGTLEMCTASIGAITTFQKKFFILDIPFLFKTYNEAWMVLDSKAGITLLDSLEEVGLKGLSYMENGFRHITTSGKEVNTVTDLEGLKIRTMNASMHILNFQSLRANPTPVPFSELYMALSQKIVDGQENPLSNIWDLSLFEVQKTISLTGHIYDAMPIIANLAWWDKLPTQYKKIISQGALYGQNYSRYCNALREDFLEEKLTGKGMKIIKFSNATKEELRAKSQKIVSDKVKAEVGNEFVDDFFKNMDVAQSDIVKGVN